MKTKDISKVLASMYPLRRELVPCFIGAPGIGKTQGVHEFAKSMGVKVVTFILSNAVPSEVSGIRMPDNDNHTLVTFDDARMASLEDGDILFFDEILEAPPMLWSSILTLIQDRTMASGRKLPDVMIVAASNPVASAGMIPPSVRDRFEWCELTFDFPAWRGWFWDKFGYEVPENAFTLFKSDGGEYNILTPRKFVKLFEWYLANQDDEDVIEWIGEFHGWPLVKTFKEIMKSKDKFDGRRIVREMKLAGIDLPTEWQEMSLYSIFNAIQELDDGEYKDSIMDAMKNFEIPEEEDECES